jgi:2-methylcitrate dehydratase PrpD
MTRPFPAHVAHHARRALIDWFAALLPGCSRPPATLLSVAMAGERGAGRAINYVDGNTGGIRYAALLNATASHTVEFDGHFPRCRLPPGLSRHRRGAGLRAAGQQPGAAAARHHRGL